MALCTPDPQQRGFADQDGVAPAGKGAGWIFPAPWPGAYRILSSGFRHRTMAWAQPGTQPWVSPQPMAWLTGELRQPGISMAQGHAPQPEGSPGFLHTPMAFPIPELRQPAFLCAHGMADSAPSAAGISTPAWRGPQQQLTSPVSHRPMACPHRKSGSGFSHGCMAWGTAGTQQRLSTSAHGVGHTGNSAGSPGHAAWRGAHGELSSGFRHRHMACRMPRLHLRGFL